MYPDIFIESTLLPLCFLSLIRMWSYWLSLSNKRWSNVNEPVPCDKGEGGTAYHDGGGYSPSVWELYRNKRGGVTPIVTGGVSPTLLSGGKVPYSCFYFFQIFCASRCIVVDVAQHFQERQTLPPEANLIWILFLELNLGESGAYQPQGVLPCQFAGNTHTHTHTHIY